MDFGPNINNYTFVLPTMVTVNISNTRSSLVALYLSKYGTSVMTRMLASGISTISNARGF
jgi:hypothetical protein